MRASRLAAPLLAACLGLALGPAGASAQASWARRGPARSVEAALVRGVTIASTQPADVDGDGVEDALLTLARGEGRALAVARRRGRAYWTSERGDRVRLRRFGADGAPLGPTIETGIARRGRVVHATPTSGGGVFTLRHDEWEGRPEDDGIPEIPFRLALPAVR